MSKETESNEPIADSVSPDTLRQMNFLTGSSIKDQRNVTVLVNVNQRRYELHFDDNGNMKSRRLE
jgi:hypothetical protein